MSTPTAQITGDITVQQCTVTVVRRGGWSWGPDPRGMVQQVLDALPDLIADRFAEHLASDGPDVEITEPITMTVRLESGRWPANGLAPAEILVDPMPIAEVAAGVPDLDTVSFEESFQAECSWSPPSVAALFGELAERGELDPLLALLPDDSVRVYLLALLNTIGREPEATSLNVVGLVFAELAQRADPIRLNSLLPEPLRDLLPDARSSAPASEAVITLLTRLFTELIAYAGREDVVRLVESLPGPPSAAEPPAETPAKTSRIDRHSPVDSVMVAQAAGEVRVWSVLPFLLAGPLARVGYLDAIGPALAGLDLAEDAPLFAAALAYKVLGVTERGWRRAERDSVAAAVFAGLNSPVPEEELVGFARRIRPALPVLDGVLALSLCRGHDPADPLLIMGADDRLLLVDAQGMFPIAWAEDVSGLVPHWRACGSPPVLVCDGPLPPGCLGELASAGVRFVTDVRPLRGDPVSRLPWRTPLWTVEGAEPDPRLAADLSGHAERLGELVRAVVVERRAVPLAEHGDLEGSVTLAAALGLGTIAWMLWRDRESPDPVLALTRFADLEASVRFESDAVRVRVPLGRRHADLLRAGLLSNVPGVVWLGGRTLTFSGG